MNRIKELRILAGMKQSELAAILNVSRAALSGYETGKFEAPLDTYIAIADHFGVTIDYLLGISDTPLDKIKKPVPDDRNELDKIDRELIDLLSSLGPEDARLARAYIQALADRRGAGASGDE